MYPAVKNNYQSFLSERKYYLWKQKCASTRIFSEEIIMYSESTDNVDHVKDQIMAYWLEKNIAFDP